MNWKLLITVVLPSIGLSLFLGACKWGGPAYSNMACHQSPSGAMLCSTGTLNKIGTCAANPGQSSAIFDTRKLTSQLSKPMASTLSNSHRPAALAGLTDLGELDPSKELPVLLSLKLRNEEELDARLAAIYQPGNPEFHHYLKPEQFRALYAPTNGEIEKTREFLTNSGLREVRLDPTGYLMWAKATPEMLRVAFDTSLHRYRGKDGTIHFAPAREPRFPPGLPIRGVIGLDDIGHYEPLHHRSSQSSPHGHGPNGGFSPDDIRKLYDFPAGVGGAGQTVALMELDGYVASDIGVYANQFGISVPTLENILVNGYSGGVTDAHGSAEVTLDIELVVGMAPSVSKIQVYETSNTNPNMLANLARIASDNAASQMDISWGGAESDFSIASMNTENTLFKQMATQGMSVFVSSGDWGAFTRKTTLTAVDPAAQPYIISVGGTQIDFGVPETTWNQLAAASNDGGGGGVSAIWGIPPWQIGLSSSSNFVSETMRNFPDVSLDASTVTPYAIFSQGSWINVGGTSASAPVWTAFAALVNGKLAAIKAASAGFMSPTLYSLGRTSQSIVFNDIADSSNNGFYPALAGFDDATGWGSFKGTELFNALVSLNNCANP